MHKHYLIALGVDEDLNVVLPARRVELSHLESWMKKTLRDCFLKTLWDTDATDFTEFHGKNRNKKAPFREIRIQKDGNNDLRNTL